MAKITETGHAKTLANFKELCSFVSSYGTDYNPSNAKLSLASLQLLSSDAQNSLYALNEAASAYSSCVSARDEAFESLKKLSTRILNALKATETTAQVDDTVRTLVRKIQGTRAKAKLTDDEKKALEAKGEEKILEISASQTSFNSRLEHLDKLIKLLAGIPQYKPNEEDLKIESLTALYNVLMAKNAAVVNAGVPVSNNRIARNDILYKVDTGLTDIALAVKAYIKSLFGATSPQFKQVSGLAFKTLKT